MIRRRGAALALLLALATVATCVEAQETRRSGFMFMSPGTQAMQRDDMENPGMLAVLDGAELWAKPAGTSGRSCADCHGGGAEAMRGVAARYPAFDDARGAAIDLAGRILQCRAERQGDAPPPRESRTLLALTAFVAHRARGMPVAPDADPRMTAVVEAGRALWHKRLGRFFEIGTLYTMLAGMLNALVIYDAFSGPMHPAPRDEKKEKR